MTAFHGRLRRPDDDDEVVLDSTDANLPSIVPRFHSRFGGLWTDLTTSHDVLRGRVEMGSVDENLEAQLAQWIDTGFLIIENAVPHNVVDAVLADIESTLTGTLPPRKAEWWEADGKKLGDAAPGTMDKAGAKLLDLHFTSDATRQMIFAPPILAFLRAIFDRPPLAFQSLAFTRGTQQPVHQDTAFVRVSSTNELAACWVALEDVLVGSGEFEYYPGSHQLEEELFEGRYKSVPEGSTTVPDYSDRLHRHCREGGLTLERFLPKKGDALIWAADLIHGGREDVDSTLTRRSLVTHYCPLNREPVYFRKDTGREKIEDARGGFVCEERWY